jgi:hypothetical protein
MGAHMCTNCQFHPENAGKKLTLKPTLMYDNREDENKIVKFGEPQDLSTKSWYYYCSLCSYRTPINRSNLKRQYIKQKSFVKSIETGKKKPSIPTEDYNDLAALGVPTSLVGETNTPPPGY